MQYVKSFILAIFFFASLQHLYASPFGIFNTSTNEKDDEREWSPQSRESLVTSIPFLRAGNLIIVKAKADSIEGNFILDTGAPGLVLNLTYFRHYQSTPAEDRGGVNGVISAALQTTIGTFCFGEDTTYRLSADLINLGHIEDRKGIKILGLLGVSFFRQSEVIIDYENSVIYVRNRASKKNDDYKNPMLDDTAAYSIMPIDIIENKIIAYTKMAGKKLKLIVDTGAESNILNSRLSDKILENVTITGRSKILGSGNRTSDALHGDMKNMQFGDRDFLALPVLITNLSNVCISTVCCIDGMLGFDFLSLHKIGFNFAKQEMYIWK